MKETFSNLPIDIQIKKKDSLEDTILYFDSYNKLELQFKASESDAVIAFFKKRGMEDQAARGVAFIFLKQCKNDGVKPLELLSDLQKLDTNQTDNVLGEILNINRINISALGSKKPESGENPAKRNIIA
jgi:hypothetical protein